MIENQALIEKTKTIVLGFLQGKNLALDIAVGEVFNPLSKSYFRLPNAEDIKDYRVYIDLIIANKLYLNFDLYSEYLAKSQENQRMFNLFAELRLIFLLSKDYQGIRDNLLKRKSQIKAELLNQFNKSDIDSLLEISLREELFYQKILTNFPAPQEPIAYKQQDLEESLENEATSLHEDSKAEANLKEQQDESETAAIETALNVKSQSVNQSSDANNNILNKEITEAVKLGTSNSLAYKVYSKKYDEIVRAERLLTKKERQSYWQDLQSFFSEYQTNVTASKLKLSASLRKYRSFSKKTHYGRINHSRLAAIYKGDNNQKLFVDKKKYKDTDQTYTILFDNSGSLHGRPIKHVVDFIYSFSKILERLKIKYEILGFTSRSWKGGRCKLAWEKEGKPNNPGRLNEQRYVIYKDRNSRSLSSLKNLSLVVKPGFLKENIDGEALEWAYKRSKKYCASKKYLIYVSDGVPIDDATLNCNNDPEILTRHLAEIVKLIESNKQYKLIVTGPHTGSGDIYQNFIPFREYKDIKKTLLKKMQNISKF